MNKLKLKSYYCPSCKIKEDTCEYLEKLPEVTDWSSEISIYPSTKESELPNSSKIDGIVTIHFSCGMLRRFSVDEIRQFVSSLSQYQDVNDVYDQEETNLSYEQKVQLLKEKLRLQHPIEVITDSNVNAYATPSDIISITTGALDKLSIDEIAFTLAHEESHIESEHVHKRIELSKKIAHEVVKSWANEKSLGKKLLNSVFTGVAGLIANTALNYSQEIEADIKAKQKLRETEYDEESGEKLFNQFNNGFSVTHPSSEMRGKILKNI